MAPIQLGVDRAKARVEFEGKNHDENSSRARDTSTKLNNKKPRYETKIHYMQKTLLHLISVLKQSPISCRMVGIERIQKEQPSKFSMYHFPTREEAHFEHKINLFTENKRNFKKPTPLESQLCLRFNSCLLNMKLIPYFRISFRARSILKH